MRNEQSDAGVETTPRRPVSVPHLVTGLVFLGMAATWALQAADVIGTVDVAWLLPAVLVAAGLAGLAASAGRALRRTSRDDRATDPGEDA